MSRRKRAYPKAIKSNKNKIITFSKLLDDYLSKNNSLDEIDFKERYDVFYKSKWLGSFYYKRGKNDK